MGNLDFGFGNQAMDARDAAIKGKQLQNEETQRGIDNQKKLEGVMTRMAARMDQYTGGGTSSSDDNSGLEQLGGPQDASVPAGPRYSDSSAPSTSAPGLQPVGPQDSHHQVGFGLYQDPSVLGNPKFLDETAKDFMAAGLPDGVKWLEAGYKAQKEGLLTATQRAVAGDLPGAEQAFNATGEHKVQPGSLKWKDDKKDVLQGKNEDGSDFEVDPKKLLKSFLSPQAFFEQNQKEQETAVKENEAKTAADVGRAHADYFKAAGSWMRERSRDPKSGNAEKLIQTTIDKAGIALQKQIEAEQSREDAKYNVNGMIGLLPAMKKDVGQMIRDEEDPEVAYNTVYNNYKNRVSSLQDVMGGLVQNAEKGNYFQSAKDATLRDSISKMLDSGKITPDEIKQFLPATKVSKSNQDRITKALGELSTLRKVNAAPARAAGAVPAATAKIAEPKTQAEFAALKAGATYRDPDDGKLYTKK
jgi:hypothetical protein